MRREKMNNAEDLILEKLEELRNLNRIGAGHTTKYISEWSQKKSVLKDELNDLIVFLKKTGSDHPDLRRFV